MPERLPIVAAMADLLARHGPALMLVLAPLMLLHAGLMAADAVAVAKMDRFLPVETMQQATGWSVILSAVAAWGRLCLIGAGVWLVLRRIDGETGAPAFRRFMLFWCAVALAFALANGGLELWRNGLRFRDWQDGGETMRALWLAGIYGQIALFWLACRLWAGAAAFARGEAAGPLGAWSRSSFALSLWICLLALLLKLAVETVLVTATSYLPVIAPFWFVPNELSESRYFVGQGTRIAVESAALVLYAAFWAAVDRSLRTARA